MPNPTPIFGGHHILHVGRTVDVITHAWFQVNRFRGFGAPGGRKWPSAIDLAHRPYNSVRTNVPHCDIATEVESTRMIFILCSVLSSVCLVNLVSNSTRKQPSFPADGSSCCTLPDAVVDRWREQYSSILKHAPTTNCAGLDTASASTSADPNLKSDPPILEEVMKAVQRLKNGKAAWCDIISRTADLRCWTERVIATSVPAIVNLTLQSMKSIDTPLCYFIYLETCILALPQKFEWTVQMPQLQYSQFTVYRDWPGSNNVEYHNLLKVVPGQSRKCLKIDKILNTIHQYLNTQIYQITIFGILRNYGI